MAKLKLSKKSDLDLPKDPIVTPRFGIALLLIALGIGWIAYYYVGVRPNEVGGDFTGPKPVQKLEGWNYLIGFILLFVGLAFAAHPKTPLGRGRGVVVGMLGCFLIGLIWIVLFYFVGQDDAIPVMKDLDQWNLVVGIGFMAVGFTYATKWE